MPELLLVPPVRGRASNSDNGRPERLPRGRSEWQRPAVSQEKWIKALDFKFLQNSIAVLSTWGTPWVNISFRCFSATPEALSWRLPIQNCLWVHFSRIIHIHGIQLCEQGDRCGRVHRKEKRGETGGREVISFTFIYHFTCYSSTYYFIICKASHKKN